MPARHALAAAALLAALALPTGTAHASHGPAPDPTPVSVSDPVCATDGTNCQPQPATYGPDRICDLHPNDPACATTVHRVARGEWLWKIARTRLSAAGKPIGPRNVRKIADMIYADNRRVIGPNKNRLRPGQRLTIRPVASWPV